MAEVKSGERLRCADCGTEIVVIKPGGPVPRCCGKELESVAATAKR